MHSILVYDRITKMFIFRDLETAQAALYEKPPPGMILTFRIYGGYRFPDGTVFPTFSASQLVDALMWATQHGELVQGPPE